MDDHGLWKLVNSKMIWVRSGESMSLKLKSRSLSVSPILQSIVLTRDEISYEFTEKE